jgi:cyclohexanecarboxylate-CoA ligase
VPPWLEKAGFSTLPEGSKRLQFERLDLIDSAGVPGAARISPEDRRTETLRYWMERNAAAAPDRPACFGPDVTLSYGALHGRAMSVANGFRALGLKKGDVIAAQLPNGIEFILTYLAAGYIGAVLQTIHMPYRAAEIEPMLKHGKAKAMVCLSRMKDFSPSELALSLRSKLSGFSTVIAVGPDAPDGAVSFTSLENGETAPVPESVDATDRFLLLYTSGTTAAPKGVPVSYDKFLANARLSAPELGIGGNSILLSAAPFTHLYGLFSINLAIAAGAATAVMPAFTPGVLAAALDAYRPTGLFVAPAHMAACLNEGLLTPERLSSLGFMLISGSACPPELARSLQDIMTAGKVCQLWGMSEMQAGTFTRPDDSEEARLKTAGRASPGTDLRVANESTPLPAGTEGELQARGISLFEGYLENPQATAAAFTEDGWFRTGDLAQMDEGGNVRITGRLKELINRGGVKFNPADIEAVIGLHPSVTSCAIVPMPDPVLGERACCFIVAAPGAAIDLDELRAWLSRHEVAKNKWPERVEIIDEMPMTPTRKIKKNELAKLAAGG